MKITDSSCGGGGGGGGGGDGGFVDDDLFRDPRSWPPGFRFHPTDEELILYYLKRKICRRRLKLNVIRETDVYKWDPEELPGLSMLKSGDRQWYFFSPRDRKYPNGARSNRATRHGYWKATGKDRNVAWNSRSVGVKKTLVFYKGRAPSGERTDWVMHEYTLDELELKRYDNVQDYYALYKLFKKSGPGPKNGEQYGAPFREEDWADDDELVDKNTPNEENPVWQKECASVDNLSFNQNKSPSDDLDEIFRQIANEPEINPLPISYALPQVGLQEETQSTMMGPSLGEVISAEPSVSWHPHGNQCDAHASFDATQSAACYLPSCEAPEVTSASNVSEQETRGTEEIGYLEIDDLEGPQQLGFSNMINASCNSHFNEINNLNGPDMFFDAAMFLQDMGNINDGVISDPYFDSLRGDFSSQVAYQLPTQLDDGDQVTSQLWMHEQRYDAYAGSNQVVMAPPTSESVDVIHGSSSTNFLSEQRWNQGNNESGGLDSWFTSAISTFLESVPARPALASENALINRAFERMSSFGRVRIAAIDAGVATGAPPVVERRVGRNGGFFFLSVLGVVCAILWMLMIGTTLKILKNFLGRFISSL